MERGKLDGLRKQGRYEEMIHEMERVLALHEEVTAKTGFHYKGTCNHGFSYLWVSLYPASDNVPQHLGFGLTWCLYDAWHDQGYQRPVADGLSKAMTRSKHPLLRALAYWVEQDYAAFEREALAGAAAGDRRMDALALVAACAVSQDKKAALEIVRPILDRGVGLGGRSGGLPLTSTEIRAYLDGSGPAPQETAFMGVPGLQKSRAGRGLHFPAGTR